MARAQVDSDTLEEIFVSVDADFASDFQITSRTQEQNRPDFDNGLFWLVAGGDNDFGLLNQTEITEVGQVLWHDPDGWAVWTDANEALAHIDYEVETSVGDAKYLTVEALLGGSSFDNDASPTLFSVLFDDTHRMAVRAERVNGQWELRWVAIDGSGVVAQSTVRRFADFDTGQPFTINMLTYAFQDITLVYVAFRQGNDNTSGTFNSFYADTLHIIQGHLDFHIRWGGGVEAGEVYKGRMRTAGWRVRASTSDELPTIPELTQIDPQDESDLLPQQAEVRGLVTRRRETDQNFPDTGEYLFQTQDSAVPNWVSVGDTLSVFGGGESWRITDQWRNTGGVYRAVLAIIPAETE